MATIDDRSITPEHAGPHSLLPRWSSPQKILLIAVLTCLAYLPSINGKFILDDDIYLTANKYIESPDGLYWFWFTNAPVDFYPVSNTSLWVEWRLWGLNPTGYHVTNLLLHIASALLVWAVLRKLLVPGAFLAALLFAIHPVNVEAVAWISQRKDLLGTLFFLLAILWYVKADQSFYRGPQHSSNKPLSTPPPLFDKWYRLSLLAFMLAMLSKGTPATLPIVLLALAWWQRGKITRFDLWRSAPFFLVAVALALMNVWTQHRVLDAPVHASFIERLLTAGAVVWFYLSTALAPIHLVFVYPLWRIQTHDLLWWLPLIAAVAVTLWLGWRNQARGGSWSRSLFFGWILFGIALSPIMGFADVGFMRHSLVADHYQHIAIVALLALVAAAWNVWHDRASPAVQPLAVGIAVAVVAMLTIFTWQQNRLYADPITLYRAALEENPTSWMIRNNLGSELNAVGQPQEAIQQCQEALRLKPGMAEAYYNIATAQKRLGQLEQAVENYRRAITLKPNYPDAYTDFGAVLGRLGRLPEAIEQFQKAISLDPNYVDAYSGLGQAYFELDRPQEAIEQFQVALRLQPKFAGAHLGLARVLAHEGRLQDAIEHYQQAIKLKPQLTEAYIRLAETYAQMHRPAEAIAAARRA